MSENLFKENKSIIIILCIIVFAIGGYYFYHYKQKEKDCLEKINYGVSTYEIREDAGFSGLINRFRRFKTHDEAMQYCMKVL